MTKISEHKTWLTSKIIFQGVASAIIGLAFYIRLIGLDRGIWLDEYWALHHIFNGGMLRTLQVVLSDNQLPAFYILLKIWSQLGNNEP